MFKFNKKNLLYIELIKTTPLLTSLSKGEKNNIKLKERISIKKIQDINGMQISYDVIKK